MPFDEVFNLHLSSLDLFGLSNDLRFLLKRLMSLALVEETNKVFVLCDRGSISYLYCSVCQRFRLGVLLPNDTYSLFPNS